MEKEEERDRSTSLSPPNTDSVGSPTCRTTMQPYKHKRQASISEEEEGGEEEGGQNGTQVKSQKSRTDNTGGGKKMKITTTIWNKTDKPSETKNH